MKAAFLEQYGAGSAFTIGDVPKPTARAGHVVVRVAASSVNTVDTMIRDLGQENLPFAPNLPAILGMDFAGTVEEVGDGVTTFAVGDEVYGCAGGLNDLQGALAEYMLADVRLIAKKPSRLSMREAAALPLVGITAFEGVQRAGVRAGQKVLVHGGAGGVGHVAVQLAKHRGADVHATVRSGRQTEVVAGYGVKTIDFESEAVEQYVQAHTGGAGFDVIFDTVGGENLTTSFEAAALNGHVATTVSLLALDLSLAHFKGLSVHVVFMLIPMLHDVGRAEHGAILAELAQLVDDGSLEPLLDDEQYDLDTVAQAYSRLIDGPAIGKVVIDV